MTYLLNLKEGKKKRWLKERERDQWDRIQSPQADLHK